MPETTDGHTTPATAVLADFGEFSAQAAPGRTRRSLLAPLKQPQIGIVGVYESADEDGHVRVRLDTTGEVV